MDYYKTFLNWRDGDDFDAVTWSELSEINDLKEIEDRFYKELEFGTGGLRGLMGAKYLLKLQMLFIHILRMPPIMRTASAGISLMNN